MDQNTFYPTDLGNRLKRANVLSKPFANNHLRKAEAQSTSLFPRD